jgi:hypothetical protein
MPDSERNPPRPGTHPPGYDEEDPYVDVDLDSLPEWWRRNVEKFRDSEMRPYRPPRFSDGELTPETISQLEQELDVSIRFRAINPHEGESWRIWVDGTPIETVEHIREGEGFTRYDIESTRFERIVRNAVAERTEPDDP